MQLFRRALTLATAALVSSLTFTAATFGQNPLQVRPQIRVSSTVDNKVRTQLVGGVPAVLSKATETGRLNGSIRMNHMLMVLQPSSDQDQALRTLTDQQNEKGSANYQKWITPAQFGQSFGISDSDIAAVTGWLQSQGMTIDQVTAGKRLIEFSGSVAQVESAFGTEMHSYSVRGEKHVSANSSITVPSALASVIASVPTLHDFFKKSYMTKPTTAVAPVTRFPAMAAKFPGSVAANTHPDLSVGSTHYFGALDFQTVYNTAPLINAGNNGAGTTIGVIGRTDINLNDVQIYRTIFGLPNNDPMFTVVGEDPGVVAGDDGESYLDVEVSGGVAPGAKINFITSKATLTTDGVDLSAIYAVQNNAVDIITESYGQCEADFAGTSEFQFYQDLWGQAAAQGISVFVSSGDNGPASCDDENNSYETAGYAVSLLASSPFNVAVGGSDFFEGTGTYWSTSNGAGYESALSYIPEQPWNESYKNSQGYAELCGLCSGSGGVSAYFQTPSWQRGPGVPTSDPAYPNVATADPSTPFTTGPHRYLPDVALNAAAGHDGTIYCAEGVCQIQPTGIGFGVVGGTSVAAPSMAGVQALVDAANGGRQGNPNFHYYALAIANNTAGLNCTATGPPAAGCVFNDIAAGNNIVCGGSSTCAAANKIGWTAGSGYDLASGLGSVNVANLATEWSTVSFTSSVTSLNLTPSAGLIHGQTATVTLTVAPGVGGTGTPTGQVGVFASQGALTNPTNPNTSGFLNQPAYCTLSGGTCTISLGSLPAGSYNLFARYSGDATYGSSTSTSIPMSVAKESSTTTFVANTFSCTTGALTGTNAITYGSAVYLDTTVAGVSGQGVPTGKISLLDNNAALASVALNATGNSEIIAGVFTGTGSQGCVYGYANPNLASLTGGVHSITVTYPGDSNFGASSTANPYNITVSPAALTASLKTTAAGINAGGSTTLTFLLTPLDASAQAVNATGTVTFTDTTTGTVLGTGTIARGLYSNATYFLATLTTPNISVAGANTISATYSGDTNYASTTATTTVTVGALAAITTGAVTSTSVTPTVAATNTLTFTASAYNGAAPTGTVSFYDNGTTLLGSGTLGATSHTATLATRTVLGAGVHSITGVYSGSTTYATYTSPALQVTVGKATPTLNLSVKAGTTLGSTATLTVLITVPESGSYVAYIAPTGTVQYYDNGNPLGSPVALTPPVTYANGGYGLYETILNTTALTTGSNAITATFTDNNYATTTTNSETVTIAQYTPTLTVSAPSTVYAKGASIPFTAVLTVPAGTAAPMGSISFYDGSTSLGMVPLSASGAGTYAATLPGVTTLQSGPNSITAQFIGDTNYSAVTSAPITEIITTNNVWVANGNGSVSAITESGTAVTTSAVSGGGTGIAIDNAGDVWSLNTGSVAEFSNTGTVISPGYTGGGINAPTALTIDGAGLVWVTNGNNTLSVLSPTGTPVSTTAYTSLLATPTTVNVDGSGNLWITNAGDNSVTEVIGVATPVTTPQTTAVKNSSVAARP